MAASIDSLATVDESKEVMSESGVVPIVSAELEEEKLQSPECATTNISINRALTSDRVPTSGPFKRWVNSLRPKRTYGPEPQIEGWQHVPRGSGDQTHLSFPRGSLEQQWEKLSGKSSHLGTIKTATISITSQSVARSRRTTQSTTNRSKSDFRTSIDSLRPTLTACIDEEAQNRAIKRRQVLQEIITTESDYLFDLKALLDLLLIIQARPEIYHNVQRIRECHESFLKRTRSLVPTSNIPRMQLERMMNYGAQKRPDLSIKAFQHRSLRAQSLKAYVDRRLKQLASEANEALVVAREIGYLSKSFIYYKEFCERYDLLVEDIAVLRNSVPNWQAYEQGIEALTKSAASMETRSLYDNKSLCLNDILIKDDPSAHDGIRQVVENVREVLADINEATASTLSRSIVEKTFLLQDMLDKTVTTIHIYQQLGPMSLCGVLHVTYRASTQPRRVKGTFMVCVLFKHHFFLAKLHDECRKLQPLACLYISDVRIDSLSNGKGYEYFCVFSWKLLFQLNDEKYEIVLSASSATEEKQWKTGILKSAAASVDVPDAVSSELRGSSFLVLDIAPEEEISDIAPQLSRRPSLQTLGTIGMQRVRSNLQPIIIRKTYCPHKHSQLHQVDGELERPKVPPPISQPFTITARRQDRIRLERTIYPIYTRDILPYPGMFLGASELFFGPGSIMRHLSLRPKRNKRSSSINLPTSVQNSSGPQGTDDYECNSATKRKRLEASDFSHSFDHEKGWALHKDSALHLGRSRTMRLKTRSRSSNNLKLQPPSNTDKGSDIPNVQLRKGFWSVFNSMPFRWSKKNARPGLGGT
ncbi:putative Rho guanyl nucleotide exchange factor [Aspergillus foveolatus]|uniref:putative Rho guanyl nucleotide exchange factor n=1 Tax=Aspergillus foveolatus TaxID=210207 RepID=UPI003CCD4EBB